MLQGGHAPEQEIHVLLHKFNSPLIALEAEIHLC